MPLETEKVAVLYWLHLADYTDVFTQGYVGVTTRSIDVRFKEHCSRYNNSYNSYNPLHLAFNKYGTENIIKTRLCVSTAREIYEIEKIFRPFEYMGWNTAQGGKLSQSALYVMNRRKNAILNE